MFRHNLATLGFVLLASAMLHPHAGFADDNGPSHLKNETLVVARIGDSNSFAAYSKHSGKWSIHKFADGLTVVPVLAQTLVAFQVSGDSVAELVAVDKNGEWRTHKLPSVGSRTCTPFVASHVAAFSVDGIAYGFSGLDGSFDSVALSESPQVSEDYAMIVSNDRIAVFSAHIGSWAESPVLRVAK